MALIGRQLTSGNYLKLDDISSQFNSSTITFNLTTAGQPFYPGSVFSVLISVGDVIQEPATSYTIDQATITFTSAPTTGSAFFGIVLGISLGVGVPGDGTVTGSKLSLPFNYNSGLLYLDSVNNRVGILSTSPTVALDVVGNSRVSGTTNLNGLSVTGIATLSGTTIFNPGPVLVGTATSTGTANQKLQVNGGAYVSSGLGIGTTSPSGLLDVSGGTIRVRSNGTYAEPLDNAGVLAYDSALSEFTVSSRSASTNSYLRFLTSNSGTSGERLRITAEGNLLVGTASSTGTASQPLQVSGGAYVSANLGVGRANPTYKIDVFGGSGLRVGGVSGDGYLLAYDTSSGNNVILEATDFLTTTKRNFAIQPNGGVVLVGTATSTGTASQPLQVSGGAYVSGNVGIGTTNPSTKLDVNGTITASGSIVFQDAINTNTYGFRGLSGIITLDSGSVYPTGWNLQYGNTSSSALYINSSGNVLINTSSATGTASQPLQVSGGAYVSGNVGIGTTNPSQKLQVQNGGILVKGAATPNINFEPAGSLGNADISFDGTTFNVVSNSSSAALVLGTYSAERLRITAIGNVGIGTTSPAENLHIHNPNTSLAVIRLSGSAASQTPFNIRQGIVGTSNAGFSIYDVNNSATRFAIDSSGNVGIGTDNPGSKLTVAGQFQSTQANSTTTGGGQIYLNGATGNRIDFNGNGVAAPAFTTRSAGTKIVLYPGVGGSSVDYALGIDSSTFWYSTYDSTTQFKWYAGTTNIATLFGTGQLVLGTTSLTGTASQPLQVTGGAYVSGNLGVGVASPTYNLDVNGTANITTQISLWGKTIGQPQTLIEPGKIYATSAGLGPGDLLLQPTGGNIGIGTNSPSTLLDVNGAGTFNRVLNIAHTAGSGNSQINFTSGGAGASGFQLAQGLNSQSFFLYDTAASAYRLFVSSAGNVGINDSSPLGKLSIFTTSINTSTGYSGQNFGIIIGTDNGDNLYDEGNGIAFTQQYAADGSDPSQVRVGAIVGYKGQSTGNFGGGLKFKVQPTGATPMVDAMVLTKDGNLGIGATIPGSKLQIVGDIRFGKQDYSYQAIQKVATLNADGVSGVYPPASFRFYTYPGAINTTTLKLGIRGQDDTNGETSDIITIVSTSASSGSVGIGTTVPLQKLHVNGNLLVSAGSSTGQHITQKAYELNSGTLSWEGSAGQLFSITNNLTSGSIFSVNDVSGIPSIDVNANGTVLVAPYGGNLGVGTISPTAKLHVSGDAKINDITVGKGSGTNTTGTPNTAVGYQALVSNANGYSSTAVGYLALTTNTAGYDNTVVGSEALRYNTTGFSNTATGTRALRYNTTGFCNTATGSYALYVNTTGIYNTANGYSALYFNTTGGRNTATGCDALRNNTTGINNVATGYQALYSATTASGNTANGYQALYSATDGQSNTATGYNALRFNTGGICNNATGSGALYANTTGNCNTAIGHIALYSNTNGYHNTANGYRALMANTTGAYNIATGSSALRFNTTGIQNTANGYRALYSNTTGTNNTATGYYAGNTNTTGTNNTFLGNNAVNTAGGATASDTIVLGNSSVTTLRCQTATISALSDARDKKDVINIPLGLDFLNDLRPVKFTWNQRDRGRIDLPDSGFIAQEALETVMNYDADWFGLVDHQNPEHFELSPAKLIPVLVKAVQELSQQNQELKTLIDSIVEKT